MPVEDIRQGSPGECGPACLAAVLSHHGHRHALREMHANGFVSALGWNMLHMKKVAESFGLMVSAGTTELDDLAKLRLPAVLHWNFNHYVVLTSVGKRFAIHDPAVGPCLLNREEVSRAFTGVAMTFEPVGIARSEPQRRHFDWRRLRNIGRPASWLLAIGGAVVAVASAMLPVALIEMRPIDSAGGLTAIVLSVFVALALMRFAFSVSGQRSRELESFWLGNKARANIMSVLMRIPFHVFERRDSGEFVSVIDRWLMSADTVHRRRFDIVTRSLFIVMTLAATFAVNLQLGFYSMATTLVVIALGLQRRTHMVEMRRRWTSENNSGRIMLRENFVRRTAADAGNVLPARTQLWEARHDNTLRTNFGLQLGILDRRALIEMASAVDFIFFTALNLLLFSRGAYSLGLMLLASFLCMSRSEYARYIFASVEDIERVREDARAVDAILQLADDDVVETRRERLAGGKILAARNLSFGYDAFNKSLLTGIDLEISDGEMIAIRGPSGCGKTTLVKLLSGLYRPVSGSLVLSDAMQPSEMSTIFQESSLFSGSVRENIAGFRPDFDDARIWDILRALDMENVVRASNMQLDTQITSGGAPFSAGERQRLAFARILYEPRKLVLLDEATVHLDALTERRVLLALRDAGAAVVHVSHSDAMHPLMDRMLVLAGGALRDPVHA